MISPQYLNRYLVLILLCLLSLKPAAQTVDASSIVGKVICGYQAWFNCYGDGSPVESWRHWNPGVYMSNEVKPRPGNVTFEIYPDILGYSDDQLYQTGLGPLGDGRPAKLFSSYKTKTINQHFAWMQQHGIDGVALQRFYAGLDDLVFKYSRDTIHVRVKEAAETYGRVFYIGYDFSGMPVSKYEALKADWKDNLAGSQKLTASSAYVHQDGKPVVGLWGLGFTHIAGTAAECIELINWFKDQGCYVIGGTPTHWRKGINDSKPGFESVYEAYDMITPWTVGRYSLPEEVDYFMDSLLIPDLDWCDARGIDYQPVIFPGFGWSNWNGGSPNAFPRREGSFLWQQAYNVRSLNIPSAYIAMFDEYDEGTAIAPAADSYLSVPTDQYFLTYSADGTYIAPDFYMRLAGEITKMIKKEIPLSSQFDTKFSEGPVYFRTSVETGYDAMPHWLSTLDQSSILTNVSGSVSGGKPFCATSPSNANAGDRSIKFEGTDESAESSFAYMKVFNVDIPVEADTWLSFRSFPENSLSRHCTIDLIMTDGSTLRDSGAEDALGVPMHPGAPHGMVGEWTETICNIGNWLSGKTIDRIMVAYDYGPETGDFLAYFDDIAVYTKELISGINKPDVSFTVQPLLLFPNPAHAGSVTVVLPDFTHKGDVMMRIINMQGQIVSEEVVDSGNPIQVKMGDWPGGMYHIAIIDGHRVYSGKLLNFSCGLK